jgi:hypothetical protein
VADQPEVQPTPDDRSGEPSRRYRLGQAVLIFVLGLAFTVTAYGLFLHGEAIDQPTIPTEAAVSAHIHKP